MVDAIDLARLADEAASASSKSPVEMPFR